MLFFTFSTTTLSYALLGMTIAMVSSSGQTSTQSRAENTNSQTRKRSDGLLRDLFDLTVNQKIERIKLRKEVAETKNKCENVLAELKTKNSNMNDMKQDQDKKYKNLKDNMEKMMKTMKQRLADMIKEQEKMNKNMADMTKEQQKMNKKMAYMTKEQEKTSKKVTILETENGQLKKRLRNVSDKVDIIENSKEKVKVAFNVEKSADWTVSANTIISFGKVFMNIGGGFNTSDNIFHCPRTGLYLISVTIEYQTARGDCDIMKNEQRIGKIMKGTTSNTWGSTTGSFTVQLDKDDKVYIKNINTARTGSHSHFSGILISE